MRASYERLMVLSVFFGMSHSIFFTIISMDIAPISFLLARKSVKNIFTSAISPVLYFDSKKRCIMLEYNRLLILTAM